MAGGTVGQVYDQNPLVAVDQSRARVLPEREAAAKKGGEGEGEECQTHKRVCDIGSPSALSPTYENPLRLPPRPGAVPCHSAGAVEEGAGCALAISPQHTHHLPQKVFRHAQVH